MTGPNRIPTGEKRGAGRAAVFALSLYFALFPLFADAAFVPGARSAKTPPKAGAGPVRLGAAAAADEGDYYLVGGERVGLLRSEDEVAVRYAKRGGFTDLSKASGAGPLTRLASFRPGGIDIVRLDGAAADSASRRESLLKRTGVARVYPVFVCPSDGARMVATDEVLLCLKPGTPLNEIEGRLSAFPAAIVRKEPAKDINVYLLRLTSVGEVDALGASVEMSSWPGVEWAEPNFVREIFLSFTPDDPFFPYQQALANTGQNGATYGADVDAATAWNTETGDSSVVIAVIDDGVDTTHPDLSIQAGGYNYYGDNSDPNPVGTDGHGTGCAGIAAAIGNNALLISGIAPACRILPMKIAEGDYFTTNVKIGNAIRDAADIADVLSNSWGGGASSSYINDAIDYAVASGRGGLGSPVFFATGNYTGWDWGGGRARLLTTGLSGSYYFAFRYEKDATVTSGSDSAWVDNVCLIDSDQYTHIWNEDFEGAFPPTGWTLDSGSGSDYWFDTTTDALTGTGGSYSPRSGPITHGEWTDLRTPLQTITGSETLAFSWYVSAEYSDYPYDALYVDVYDAAWTYIGYYGPWGVPYTLSDVWYPASYASTIAVGSSTDCDLRSDYSQYGSTLDFLAPSNGGWNDIVTLDPVGSIGWTDTDYKFNFGGTSSACPLAAGIAALMISKDPSLTAAEIRTMMRSTCDEIGPYFYEDGRNDQYGYGRVNAEGALSYVTPTPVPQGSYTKDENPDRWIPDNDPAGIVSYLMVPDSIGIGDLRVYVDITHDWIGDLIVDLVSPSGTTVRLHNRTGGSTSDIQEWYSAGSLSDFDGEDCQGIWSLRVSDNDLNNIGTLNEWGMEVRGSSSLLSSPWPMFRQNKRHAGRGLYSGPASPILKWSHYTGDSVTSSPSVGTDDRVYAGSKTGVFYALNSDGSLFWTYDTGYNVRSSPALGAGGEVYVGSRDPGSFFSLNSDGSLYWSYDSDYVRSSPVTGTGGELYFGSDDNNIYSLAADGSFRWSFAAGFNIYSSPALGANGSIYIGADDNRIYSVTQSGVLAWSYLCGNVVWSSPAVSGGGTVYAGSYDANLYSLDSHGALNWSFAVVGFISSSPAIGSDGTIYAGAGDGNLYAVDSGGALSWSFGTAGSISYSSPAVGLDGMVYFGSDDNAVYALTGGGALSWSFLTGGNVRSSPAIAADGSLIVGSDDGNAYSLYRQADERLAILKREGAGDVNLYYYNSLRPGDRTYWDAIARNPLPYARDFWIIPAGNDASGIAAGDMAGGPGEELLVVKQEGASDVNLYLYNSLVRFDWTYWDAASRNPSALARDLWVIPSGNDAVGIASAEMTGGGSEELAILKREGGGDENLYLYNSIVVGDWRYWDAVARNPSPLARDLWVIPAGDDAAALCAVDTTGDGQSDGLAVVRNQSGDFNAYLWNLPAAGDWTYWDAFARNPSPLARDLWVITEGGDTIAAAAVNATGAGPDSLALIKRSAAGDVSLYYYNCPVSGDWTYWAAIARNPSSLARDFWVIPSGNDAAGLTAITAE